MGVFCWLLWGVIDWIGDSIRVRFGRGGTRDGVPLLFIADSWFGVLGIFCHWLSLVSLPGL